MDLARPFEVDAAPMPDPVNPPPRTSSFAAFLRKLIAWTAAASVLVGILWSLWWQRDPVLAIARGETTVDEMLQDGWGSITGNDATRPRQRETKKPAAQSEVGATVVPADEIRRWRGKFKPIAKGVDGTPAHWCPVDRTPIEYRIDPTNAKTLGIDFKLEKRAWRAAFDEWTRASGSRYTFNYAGKASFPIAHVASGSGVLETRVKPSSIAITYAMPGTSGAAFEHPRFDSVLGIGGIYAPDDTDMLIQRASIILDARDLVFLDADTRSRLRTHEIGHAMGLKHVKEFDVLMRPGKFGPMRPQPGDAAGIQRLANLCITSTDGAGS